jgi:hypothetical protein
MDKSDTGLFKTQALVEGVGIDQREITGDLAYLAAALAKPFRSCRNKRAPNPSSAPTCIDN